MPSVPEPPMEPKWLSAQEIDDLFFSLNSYSRIALAVSGGADSVCLLCLFNDWHRRSGWAGSCEVLTVDHQLRPESGQETAFVSDLCERLGYPCKTLFWSGTKPLTGIQEKARRERYRLLADHISVSGAQVLLVGHHADDQIETFLDRLTRGSGVFGLSSMAMHEVNGPAGLNILRPLLDVRKERLVATLHALDQPWCEDPSNSQDKYKRSRLRTISRLLAEEGLCADRILTTVRQMRRARSALEQQLADVQETRVEEHPAGPLRIPLQDFVSLPQELRLRLLVGLIERVTAVRMQPRLEKVERLEQAILKGKSARYTLGGAMFDFDAQSLRCWKEAGRTPTEPLENPVGTGTWDNRFVFTVEQSEDLPRRYFCGFLCQVPDEILMVDWPAGWPKDAFSTSPVIWGKDRILMSLLPMVPENQEDALPKSGITLHKVPFPPKFFGNYRMEQGDETKV